MLQMLEPLDFRGFAGGGGGGVGGLNQVISQKVGMLDKAERENKVEFTKLQMLLLPMLLACACAKFCANR